MRVSLFVTAAVFVASFALVTACPTTAPTDDDDDASATPTWAPPTPTAPLCNPAPCDVPGGYIPSATVDMIDDGDGTFSIAGTFIMLQLNDAWDALLCQDGADFTGDFDSTMVGAGAACPGGGAGTCAGSWVNVVGTPGTRQTDCSYENAAEWWTEDAVAGWLEGMLLAFPIDGAYVPDGLTDDLDTTFASYGAQDPSHVQTHGLWFENPTDGTGLWIGGLANDPATSGVDTMDAMGVGSHYLWTPWGFYYQ